jgi:hypothetical protein
MSFRVAGHDIAGRRDQFDLREAIAPKSVGAAEHAYSPAQGEPGNPNCRTRAAWQGPAMDGESIVDINQLCSGANGCDRRTRLDTDLVHLPDINHESWTGGPSLITVTAGPNVNGNAAATHKLETCAHVLHCLAAGQSARTDVVETCVEEFSMRFKHGVAREQEVPVEGGPEIGPTAEVSVLKRSATCQPWRSQTAYQEIASLHARGEVGTNKQLVTRAVG